MIGRSNNPAKQDQELAASEDARRILRRMSTFVAKPTVQFGGGGQEWARLIIADRLAMQFRKDPELTTCGHLMSPRPTFLPSWVKHMSCQACLISCPKPTDEDDLACDRCRVYPRKTYIAVVQAGQYTVLGGLCKDCRDSELAD